MRLYQLPNDERVLRKPCKKVKDPRHPKILMLVQEMKRLAHEWEQQHENHRCEGVAAPQVGVNLRVIILRATNEMIPKKYLPEVTSEFSAAAYLPINPEWEEWNRTRVNFDPWHVLINPRFIKSDGYQRSREGCLSVPDRHCLTMRPDNVVFDYTDLTGKHVGPKLARGFAACAVVHELDHLNGTLNIDAAVKINPMSVPFNEERIVDLESTGEETDADSQGSVPGVHRDGADDTAAASDQDGLYEADQREPEGNEDDARGRELGGVS